MVWIANTEIGMDPNNSVIKRLWWYLLSFKITQGVHWGDIEND